MTRSGSSEPGAQPRRFLVACDRELVLALCRMNVGECAERPGRGAVVVEIGRNRDSFLRELLGALDVVPPRREEAEVASASTSSRSSPRCDTASRASESIDSAAAPVALGRRLQRGRSERVGAYAVGSTSSAEREPEREPAPRLGDVRVSAPEALERRDRSERVLDPTRRRAASRARRRCCRTPARAGRATSPGRARRARPRLPARARGSAPRAGCRSSSRLPSARRRSSACSRTVSSIDRRTLAVGRLAADEAPADERLEVRQERAPPGAAIARASSRAALSAKTASAPCSCTLARAQPPVAPVDRRPERALALGEIDRAFHLEREPVAERAQDLGRRQHGEPRRDELDRERQPVESPADLVHRRERVVVQDDAARGSELDEERRRVVDRERLEREDVLARQAERRAARRRAPGGRARDRAAPRRVPLPSGRCSRLSRKSSAPVPFRLSATDSSTAAAARLAHADRARDRARDELRVRDRREPDEVDGSLERRRAPRPRARVGSCRRPRARDRHEPHSALEQSLDARECVGRGRRAGGGARGGSSRRAS